jgi:hypothetical protein
MVNVEGKLLNMKIEFSKEEFDDILEWGFFELYNFEINEKIELNYNQFKSAFSYFEGSLKPFFSAELDDCFFLFINNSYT